MFSAEDIAHGMWVFSGGAILVLLHSIISGGKRNWWSLVIGCLLGGVGAWVAGQIWEDSKYIYVICGVAAVVTEHLLAGVVNAAKQFAESPVKFFTHFAKTFLPTFNRATGDSPTPIDDTPLR